MKRPLVQIFTFAIAAGLSFFWFGCESAVSEKSDSVTQNPPCNCPEPSVLPLEAGTYQFVKNSYISGTTDFPGMKATLTREKIIISAELTGQNNKKVTLIAEYNIKELSADK